MSTSFYKEDGQSVNLAPTVAAHAAQAEEAAVRASDAAISSAGHAADALVAANAAYDAQVAAESAASSASASKTDASASAVTATSKANEASGYANAAAASALEAAGKAEDASDYADAAAASAFGASSSASEAAGYAQDAEDSAQAAANSAALAATFNPNDYVPKTGGSFTGNVGVGTPSPTVRLQVSSPSWATQLRVHRPTTSAGAVNLSSNNSDGAVTDYAQVYGFVTSTVAGDEAGDLVLTTRRGGVITENARFTSDKRVGFGTSAPAHTLDVLGPNSFVFRAGTNHSNTSERAGVLAHVAGGADQSARHATLILDPNGADGVGGDYGYLRHENGSLFLQNNESGGRFLLGADGAIITRPQGGEAFRVNNDGRVGVGTSAPRAALDVGGAFAAGREFHNVATFHQGTALAHGFKIKTNINAGSGIMCRLRISGYDYRSARPIGIDIVFYAYTATSIVASSASSYGNWTPTIQIGHEGGKVVVHLGLSVSDGYHAHFTVDASSQAAHSSPASFRGWTVVDEAYAGEHTVTPTYHNRFGFITIDGGLESHGASLVARRAGDGMVAQFFRGSAPVGSIAVTESATSYNTASDYRLPWKEGHRALEGSGEFIDRLNPRYYPKVGFAGFIAHEVQEVSPSSVTGEKDAVDDKGNPIIQSMNPSSPDIMANIVAELQSLRRRVAELEAQRA